MFAFICAVAILGTICIDIMYTLIKYGIPIAGMDKSTPPLVILSSIIGWICAAIYLYPLIPH